MSSKILLITPPFTQLNTPYPATTYLKGYLEAHHIACYQEDLGIDLILDLFTPEFLTHIFDFAEAKKQNYTPNTQRIIALKNEYIDTIKDVIHFLQNKNNTLAHTICSRKMLPEASRFQIQEDIEWAFGTMGIIDKAKHLATLYLEDLSDFIIEAIDPHFGFSRYAERISSASASFDPIYNEINKEDSIIIQQQNQLLKGYIEKYNPNIIGLSIPFPGNLFSSLKCGQYIKANYPDIIINFGGGYINTELREVSDARLFEFVDYLTFDDGEAPLLNLLEHIDGKRDINNLKRTMFFDGDNIKYIDHSETPDISQKQEITPSYIGLKIDKYLSVIEVTNPMHSLWSDGRWNKLTMAHGCYWGKCTFCDTTLDYIKRFEPSTAKVLCDRMESLIKETGESGFHFTDEAAPPALMIALAKEIIKRKLNVTWWTNVRFESTFTYDVCQLLKASGCIAVSGGMEVASDRILSLINKGVSVQKVANICNNFTQSGIMVHTYLMYGFPTQTALETINSLEVVRQFFELNIIKSGFWHQFALTCHSPVGKNPDHYKIEIINPEPNPFANNDLQHKDPTGANHSLFSNGLKKALFNYMHDVGFDLPLHKWFDFKIPKTTIAPDYIYLALENQEPESIDSHNKLFWLGKQVQFYLDNKSKPTGKLIIHTKEESSTFKVDKDLGTWLATILNQLSQGESMTLDQFETSFNDNHLGSFDHFWDGEIFEHIRQCGLLLI